MSIDPGSQHVAEFLRIVADAARRLDLFEYSLALEYERYDRGHAMTSIGQTQVLIGSYLRLDTSRKRSLGYGVYVSWTGTEWTIFAHADDEHEFESTSLLKTSNWTARSIEELNTSLHLAMDAIEAFLGQPRIIDLLKKAGRE